MPKDMADYTCSVFSKTACNMLQGLSVKAEQITENSYTHQSLESPVSPVCVGLHNICT